MFPSEPHRVNDGGNASTSALKERAEVLLTDCVYAMNTRGDYIWLRVEICLLVGGSWKYSPYGTSSILMQTYKTHTDLQGQATAA